MNPDMPCPADLVSIANYLESCSYAQRFAIVAQLNQVMLSAIVLRGDHATNPQAESPATDYTPHALDVLIISALELDGAQSRVQIVAALDGDTYKSRGRDATATEGTIKRRIQHLTDAGVIRSTSSGYVIADPEAAARITGTEFG